MWKELPNTRLAVGLLPWLAHAFLCCFEFVVVWMFVLLSIPYQSCLYGSMQSTGFTYEMSQVTILT